MNRQEKSAEVEVLHRQFQEVRNAFLVGFSGLSVEDVSDLRRKVRAVSSSYRVVKNRLARRAVVDTPMQHLEAEFQGPTAVAANSGDPVALAKVLADFAKGNPAMTVRTGVIEGMQVVSDTEISALAKLPSLPELQATLLCLIQTPATQLARLVQTPAAQIAQVIRAHQEGMPEES